MNVGFTGTRKGMSDPQKEQLALVLRRFYNRRADGYQSVPNAFHHGCADGADTEAAALASQLGFMLHPHPIYDGDPLLRNRDIVAASAVLIAAPESDKEVIRSGTWATVRYGRAAVMPIIMLSRGPI